MGDGFFAGWDILGKIKIIDERRLAYRMHYNVAVNTLKKLNNETYRIMEI